MIEINRVNWLDNLKAFAIFLVVLGHTGLEKRTEFLQYMISWIYEFHMPLFFLLSGISFSILSIKQDKSSVYKQIINILLIFVIQSILYISLNISLNKYIQTNNVLSVENYLSFILYPVVHFWYLQALVLIYLLEIVILRLWKNDHTRMIVTFIISCIGISNVLGEALSPIAHSFYHLFFFEIGRQISIYKKTPKKTPIFICILGIVLSITVLFIQYDNVILHNITRIFIALTVSLFFVKLISSQFDNYFERISILGRNCLWIYIFHSYFTAISRGICTKFITIHEITALIETFAGMVGPIIIFIFLRKLNFEKIVSKPLYYFWK